MFIVWNGKERHSAWETKSEAMEQVRVLIEYGYREGKLFIKYDETVRCENGHYYV